MFARSEGSLRPHQSYTNIPSSDTFRADRDPSGADVVRPASRGLAASVAPPPGANPNARPVEHAQTQVNRPVKMALRSSPPKGVDDLRRPQSVPVILRTTAHRETKTVPARTNPVSRFSKWQFPVSTRARHSIPRRQATALTPASESTPSSHSPLLPSPKATLSTPPPSHEPKLLNPDQIGVVAHCPSILFRSAPDRQLCRATPKSAPPKSSKSEDLELPSRDRILAGDRARFLILWCAPWQSKSQSVAPHSTNHHAPGPNSEGAPHFRRRLVRGSGLRPPRRD